MSRCLYDRLTRPKPPPRRRLPLLLGAGVVCLALVSVPALSLSSDRQADPTTPQAAVPSASPTPTPSPTQTPVPAFDFSRPAPQSAPVGMDYFADALFIGDSRTRGLALYSGIRGATFYDYTGLTIFGVGNPGLVTVDGVDCSILEALERGPQFGKIYISFGVNELGYYNEENYLHTFGVFLEQVKALQPGAVVYLQNLAPVHVRPAGPGTPGGAGGPVQRPVRGRRPAGGGHRRRGPLQVPLVSALAGLSHVPHGGPGGLSGRPGPCISDGRSENQP